MARAQLEKAVLVLLLALLTGAAVAKPTGAGVRIKELCRLGGVQDNALVGYGIVTGLAGTGDSVRSLSTLQSVSNVLLRFGVKVPETAIRSRNAAGVMVTATLPAYAQPGDKIDVNVTSLGDARSLLGGTLVLTHLAGPDQRIYALAQGQVSVGGYRYALNGNLAQKNHPTAGIVASGATVEQSVPNTILDETGAVHLVLKDPDLTTANRIATSLNQTFQAGLATAVSPARVRLRVPDHRQANLMAFLTQAEGTVVVPDQRARVVINERTGTVVSGGDVRVTPVTISHGDLQVAIDTKFFVSQPTFVRGALPGVSTEVVPETTIEVREVAPISVTLPNNSSVAELVAALNKVKATSRDVITILQAMKRAGALHADLIVQ